MKTKKCEYCLDGTVGVKSVNENSRGHFCIENGYIEVVADGGSEMSYDIFKINYCPMCGSRLQK